jgi:hypothetical protein
MPGMVMMEAERGNICRKTVMVCHRIVPEEWENRTCLWKKGRKKQEKQLK